MTGWDWTVETPKEMGLRIVNLMRMFNFRHGLNKEMEAPSVRYSSTPVDGPAAGHGIREHWEAIRENYYEQMGWDVATGSRAGDAEEAGPGRAGERVRVTATRATGEEPLR